MARVFSTKEAKQLIREHREMISRLINVSRYTDTWRNAIRTNAGTLADLETQKLLKTIPIEELNRDKQGIRVKTLREYGFKTVGDLCGVSLHRLTGVKGISEEGAYQIKTEMEEFLQQTRSTIKIRLSADDRRKAASDLVYAVYLYKYGVPDAEVCKKILKETKENIEKLVALLEPALGSIKWFFTGKGKKKQAEDSFDKLAEAMDGTYGEVLRFHLSVLEGYQKKTEHDAWADFTKDPISYFTVLEQLCPGLLGTGDVRYGLPEELAREIAKEPLHLEGLRCTLRSYQEWGVKYILHQKKALLGDEMGLGKTIQAIAAMESLKNTGATHFLVVCPASVVTNWCREIQKHSDLSVIKIHGADKESALRSWMEKGGVAITTFETTGVIVLENEMQMAMLIVDEAHYIKNPNAKRTIHTKKLCKKAERLLFMTGTALENRVEEMITLMEILQPEIAREVQDMAFLASAPQFREKIVPVYYRRKRDEVLTELPELIESKEWCELGKEEERIYEQAVRADHFANARRVSWNVKNLEESSKAQRLREIVEEAKEDGRKIIVFSFFLDTIAKVTGYFGDCCLEPINGSVPPKRRQEIVDEFDKAPAGTILPAQIQAGGTGLNIQAASVVIICEPQLKPSIENQAISRAYRMGQARNVLVYRLLADETIDERITDLLEEKQKVFDAFADESVIAKESMELDEASVKELMQKEKERIENRKCL